MRSAATPMRCGRFEAAPDPERQMSRREAGAKPHNRAQGYPRHLRRTALLASVLVAAAGLPAAAYAQAVATAPPDPSPPSAESLRQMRQELEALKAEEAAARAAEQ